MILCVSVCVSVCLSVGGAVLQKLNEQRVVLEHADEFPDNANTEGGRLRKQLLQVRMYSMSYIYDHSGRITVLMRLFVFACALTHAVKQ